MQISRICGCKGTAFLLNHKTLEAFISLSLSYIHACFYQVNNEECVCNQ